MIFRKVALNLQVGKTYIDGRGKSVTIKRHSKPPHQQFADWEFQDDLGLYFKADGTCPGMTSDRDLLRPLYSVGEAYVDSTGTLHRIAGFNNGEEYPLTSSGLAWRADGDFVSNPDRDLQDYAPAVANCVAKNELNRGVTFGGPQLKFRAPDVPLAERVRDFKRDMFMAGIKPEMNGKLADTVILDDIPMPTLEQVPPSEYRVGMYVEVYALGEWHMAKIVWQGDQGNRHVFGVEIKTVLCTTHDCNGRAKPNKGRYVYESDMRRIEMHETAPPATVNLKDVPMYHEKPAPAAPEARLSDGDKALIWNAFESCASDLNSEDMGYLMDTLIAQRRKLNAV